MLASYNELGVFPPLLISATDCGEVFLLSIFARYLSLEEIWTWSFLCCKVFTMNSISLTDMLSLLKQLLVLHEILKIFYFLGFYLFYSKNWRACPFVSWKPVTSSTYRWMETCNVLTRSWFSKASLFLTNSLSFLYLIGHFPSWNYKIPIIIRAY